MFNRGLGLSGIALFTPSSGVVAQISDDAQHVTTHLEPFAYETIVVEAGTQVV